MLTTRPRSDALGIPALRLARICAVALICAAPWASAQLSDIRPRSQLPDATLHQFYSVTFTPVNPYKGLPVLWTITPGCLDGTGLSFTPDNDTANTARIKGVPTLRGTFHCTVVAQDAAENVISKLYELSIVRGCAAPQIISEPPPAVQPGVPYSFTVVAAGKPPITFSALGLPPGLAIDPATGVIAGTPASLIPPLASATLDAGGNAAFTLTGLAIQNYVLQAYYGGDGTHDPAASVSVDQFVIKGVVFPPARRSPSAPARPSGASAEPIPALSIPMLGVLGLAIVGIA